VIVLGIDPGASGGVAWRGDDVEAHAWKFPDTERDLWHLFEDLSGNGIAAAFIERVHSMPKQGVASSFKFGQHYGMLRAFLIASAIPFEAVAPGVWQRSMGCLSKGDKNVTKRKAQELFPALKITHAIADALLLAEYGRRVLAKRGEVA
jgi:crossover junction endodeoxyribonuclease RuvC